MGLPTIARAAFGANIDVNPGDRTNDCGGMMQPMRFELDHGKQILIHKCEKCGMEKRNKIAKNDSTDAIIGLAKKANFWYSVKAIL